MSSSWPESMSDDPRGQSLRSRRLAAIERCVDRLDSAIERRRLAANRTSWLRVISFVGGLTLCLVIFFTLGTWPFWGALAVTILLFALVVRAHRRLETSLLRHQGWRRIKLGHLGRARLEWAAIPAATRFEPRPRHPFESDLDLIGEHSLHRLLNTTVSPAASRRLRDWLTALEPNMDAIASRHQLIAELAPLTLFRDKLALSASTNDAISAVDLAGDEAADGDPPLLAWLEEEPGASNRLRPWLVVLSMLALLNALLFGLAWFGLAPDYWQITLGIYAVLYLFASRGVGAVFHEAMEMRDALQQLTAVFAHLEAFSYRATPKLRELCAPFCDADHSPSAALRQAARVAAATGIQGNPLIAIAVNLVVPWNLFFAYRLGRAKEEIAGRLPDWLERWTELETLSAVANFAYLNPDYTTPSLVSPTARDATILDGRGLGHPLIAHESRVCNDFAFDSLGDIGLITGSNMAGKSTFLKTVGINMALAYAGAPVAADQLTVAPLRLFTSMRISDSLADGFSYFYAEVQRLKRLLTQLDAPDEWPLLYLIDEIFRGTNNRERLIGSSAYVRSLAGKAGVGLISTHDLELARLAEENAAIRNYHFRDEIEDGRMVFDYVIHDGPCPTTNALKIMALEGLPVDEVVAEVERPR